MTAARMASEMYGPPLYDGVAVELMLLDDFYRDEYVIVGRAVIDGAIGTAEVRIARREALAAAASSVYSITRSRSYECGTQAVLSARRRLWGPWADLLIAGEV